MILTALHSGLRLPVPIAVTVAYACAFALSYLLNRTFNFRSHAPVGPQVAIYVVVVVVNYLAFILGVTTLLVALGVHYQLSRIAAGAVKPCTCTARCGGWCSVPELSRRIFL